MSNNVIVGFSNDGKSSRYVVDNVNLANELGLVSGSILGSTYISENVSGGLLSDPYSIPGTIVAAGGQVQADYTNSGFVDEAYRFIAEGWNKVKNITVKADGNESILFIADNFVQADMDFSGINNTVELRILDVKRSNVLTGDGDDRIQITTATNNAGWSNLHDIMTGDGNDIIIVGKGDAGLVAGTIVDYVDGRFTTVNADLGEGDDVYSSTNDGVKTTDNVKGGTGNDAIFTGGGNDIIEGGGDRGTLFETGDALYSLLSNGDRLSGGSGSDEFIYNVGDGFANLGDGFDHILDFEDSDIVSIILNNLSDTYTTEIATLNTSAGSLTGAMILINGQASIFLEDYTNLGEIFV